MSKKIMTIISSPRDGANTTLLAEAFIEGADKKGHNWEVFNINKKINYGCKACNKCWSNGSACVYDDSFNEFIEKIRVSDVIVFASPVYWGSFPAPLKAFIDKMYSFCVPWCSVDISGKQPVLLTCGDGEDDTAFDQIKKTFASLAAYMKWKEPKVIAIPQLVEAGSVKQTSGIERARKLGEDI